jgi:hypothetical protein
MAKDKAPKSGPIAGKNRDRSIPPGGRPSKNQPQSPGTGEGQTGRTKDDPDTDGYSVGGRGK